MHARRDITKLRGPTNLLGQQPCPSKVYPTVMAPTDRPPDMATEVLDDAALAPTALDQPEPGAGLMVSVRCIGCGERTENRFPSSETVGMACFCADCRQEIAGQQPALPGYRVLRELGRGGMGVTYLAEHEQIGRCVLKQLLPETALSEINRKLFVREARKQAGLIHPNIVELFDFIELEPGVFVAVLEFVDGESGDRLMERLGGRLPAALAVRVVAEALQGLHFMHQRGLVHRDIKEANLLVKLGDGGALEQVKIADFGLAKSYTEVAATVLTRPGQIGGTIPYMAPEQIHHYRGTQPPADLYAMGVTLYRLLTGHYPHDFPATRHPLQVVLADPIVPLRRRLPGLPEELNAAIEKAMARNPTDRHASADAMREALLPTLTSLEQP